MASGEATRQHIKNKLPAIILDRSGNIRRNDIWAYNPIIKYKWDRVSPVNQILSGPGLRPYIASKTAQRWTWRDYSPHPAKLYFDGEETRASEKAGSGFVVVEPNIKDKASPNKNWPRNYWAELIQLLRRNGLRPVQLAPFGAQILNGADVIDSLDFRMACSILSRAVTAVLPEGGLHHGAAAVGVPSVVIYGGYISPRQTGYAMHRNLFTGDEPCGMRYQCDHCKGAMARITPECVMRNVLELIHERKRA